MNCFAAAMLALVRYPGDDMVRGSSLGLVLVAMSKSQTLDQILQFGGYSGVTLVQKSVNSMVSKNAIASTMAPLSIFIYQV